MIIISHMIEYAIYSTILYPKILPYDIFAFFSIQHIKLELPFNDRFWFFASPLDQLTSLHISRSGDDQSQLQVFPARAPPLYSLSFDFWSSSNREVSAGEYTNLLVRRLNFHNVQYVNDQQCTALSRSTSSLKCLKPKWKIEQIYFILSIQ